ncbi:hypothetical protein [Vibrio cholerae]|uniref:hypothetical protein n=1 Tax=Vibrio cholerae TaxID=666 RepID=UPI0011D33900|nr:hypothetical protein [Vibrio cholerae]EGR2536830.1 hypothetical protein [Vibrio cholerae]TXZ65666.1 hypothetical protein FXE41_04190 [Vibrio cholerae]GIB35577.1 hypothetical protein VCSRO44_2528 [Vibrio cholerae]HDZ9234491.1 hypothetical protein [Vibrio cholerae]
MLFKFGKREHLEATRSYGQLYFGSFKFYRNSENSEIGDKNEGAYRIVNSANVSLTVLNGYASESILNGSLENVTVREFSEISDESRIYCIHRKLVDTSKDVELSEILDIPLIERFGYESVLIIANVDEFYKRLDNYLSENALVYKRSCVEYKDLSNGVVEISPFVKDIRYEPQSEYRVCIQKINGEKPLVINIGSLSDITQIIDTSQLARAKLVTIA